LSEARRKTTAAMWSIVSNTTLVILKLIVGFAIGSVSVISEAIHSGVDLVAAVIAYYAVRTSGRPADTEHPFGHGKFENISGTVEALLIFLAAGWIIYEAVMKLIHPHRLDAPLWGVAVMLVSVVANYYVSRMLFRVGRETDSMALQADAWHLRTDVYTSLGVMGGLGTIAVSEWIFPGIRFHWIDAVAAICVAVLIIRAAWKLTVESARDLLDVSLPPHEQTWLQEYLATLGPPVHTFHGLRTRKAGAQRFVEMHLLLRADLSVEESHRVADEVEQCIRDRFPGTAVTIHVEPCNGECRFGCNRDQDEGS